MLNPERINDNLNRQRDDQLTTVALAEGDGIGPEITRAVVQILEAADAAVTFDPVTMGQASYLDGCRSGIPDSAWAVIRRHRILLKGPITTPQGGGYKSLNVTLRKSLGLFANVRPCRAWHPWVRSRHPDMDVLIVRENEEDTYAGIEHRQTREVHQCLKLISTPACERIIRYAFELARAQGRQRVDCMTKDNIMKLTDGVFHRCFREIARDYPEIEARHLIIDIGTALLADRPETFDVIVAPNLYGDILSDVAAQLSGSVGLAGSANIGDGVAMFEAVHGSAPDIAGRDIANPSGLLLAAVEMLHYIGDVTSAERIQAAWEKTLADGLHTGDIYDEGRSRARLGTQAFAQAVIDRLPPANRRAQPEAIHGWPGQQPARSLQAEPPAIDKQLVGVDIFLDWDEPGRDPAELGQRVSRLAGDSALKLALITNRGVKVFPDGLPETRCTDHWRCRFRPTDGQTVEHRDILALLAAFEGEELDFIKTENLYTFDGEPGFSLAQGEG
ncbi:MAG: NADP-dependent isocitrate dehydrogenase [Wenzhouxiangella sp.]